MDEIRARLESVARAYQAPVLTEMPDRVLRLAEGLVEAREVVVAVGEIGVRGERTLVRGERGARLADVLEQHRLVEEQQRIESHVAQAPPVDALGFVGFSQEVQQPA